MAHIVYTGPHGSVTTPDGITFEREKPVKVSDKLAKSLVKRNDFRESRNEEGAE